MPIPNQRRPIFAALLCLAGTAAVLPTRPASAVENIRGESWHHPALLPPSPAAGDVSVSFDADVTPLDIQYGVRFAIVVRDGRGATPVIVDCAYSRMPNLPPAWSTVRFEVRFTLECDAARGRVFASPYATRVSYLRSKDGQVVYGDGPVCSGKMAAAAARFGLAIVDQNAVAGRGPTPRDAFGCAPAANARSTESTLGVFFDPRGTVCQGVIRPGDPGKLYVLAKPDPTETSGIAGAEFRFAGVPSSWDTYAVPNPDILALGDPFGAGVTAGFPCEPPTDGVVLLYTVVVLAAAEETDLRLGIEARVPPTNPNFACPFLLRCDDPAFTKLCVTGLPCFVNSRLPKACAGAVAVETTTWSYLKALYR